jgi:hypothetical protein
MLYFVTKKLLFRAVFLSSVSLIKILISFWKKSVFSTQLFGEFERNSELCKIKFEINVVKAQLNMFCCDRTCRR